MNRPTAFTLIELLVVIAVIAILLALLVPSLQKARDQARDVVCKSHLRGVGVGIRMYLDDSNQRMPDMYTYTSASNGHLWWDNQGNLLRPSDDRAYWGVAYFDYVQDKKVFGCPAFRNFADIIAQDLLYGGDHRFIYTSAFASNGWLSKEKITSIRRCSEVILAHDHMEPRMEHGNRAERSDMLFPSPTGVNLTHYRTGAGRTNWYRGIFRHAVRKGDDVQTGGSLNTLWLDTHVSRIRETTGQGVLKRWYDPLGKNP
ncbi:MAG: type II secretion system GspH family protein [Phycisphaerae bacterium]|nr:type II secretion system GspH family protein [Phycisphaerae bacterium]